jgi:hypothetical protein
VPFFQKDNREINIVNIFSKRVRELGFCSKYELLSIIYDFRAEGLFLISILY